MHSTLSLKRCASIACILAGYLFIAAPLPVHALPLNLSSTHPGDVTTHYTQVDYTLDANPSTGTFVAEGYPDEFDVNLQGFTTSFFTLSATVNRTNGNIVGGTVTITGDTDGVPNYTGTLLTGNLIGRMGYADGPLGSPGLGNIFEFHVQVTGGALAAPYYSTGYAGIILNIENGGPSPFTGFLTSAFSNQGTGFSDTFPIENPNIPEPSSIILLALGVLPLAWRLRRRGR